jgi:3-dehydrosphinganine reductase
MCKALIKLNCADCFFQTVVITGGSDGMGKAVALELSEKGASVIVVARTISKLQAAVDEMRVRETSLVIRLPLLTYH